jgi:hypothetical protein
MLDEAGMAAVESGSVEDMLKVAAGWMEIGVNMLGAPEAEAEEQEDEDSEEHEITSIVGFAAPETRDIAEQEYEDRKR